MPEAPVAAGVHEAFDVHGNIAAQIALYDIVPIKNGPDLNNCVFRDVLGLGGRINTSLRKDPPRGRWTDTEDISQ